MAKRKLEIICWVNIWRDVKGGINSQVFDDDYEAQEDFDMMKPHSIGSGPIAHVFEVEYEDGE